MGSRLGLGPELGLTPISGPTMPSARYRSVCVGVGVGVRVGNECLVTQCAGVLECWVCGLWLLN